MPGLSIAAFAKSSWELASRNSGVEGHDCSDHCGQALGPRTQLSRMFYTVEELIGPHTIDVTGEICTRWNERESTWRKSWPCRSRGTNQNRS
jgi:hypothetical protein